MAWTTRGRLIVPDGQAAWVGTHAALPAVLDVAGGHRVFFSSRDHQNRSHIGYVTVEALVAETPVRFAPAPVLSPGALGAFDDAGVTMSCIVPHEGRLFLFYTGWALGVRVPFYLHSGLAVSDDGGESFQRVSVAPLLDRVDVDPYLNASPWVIVDGGVWRMWYVSGTGWTSTSDGPQHHYHLKYAESADGRRWKRTGHVCLDYASQDEYAFGRPCVVKDGDRYRMWFCVRGDRYRLGCAESPDGLAWTRRDDLAAIEGSTGGWDAEMMAYPVVHDADGRRVLLYNGNGYGRTGIGLAEWHS